MKVQLPHGCVHARSDQLARDHAGEPLTRETVALSQIQRRLATRDRSAKNGMRAAGYSGYWRGAASFRNPVYRLSGRGFTRKARLIRSPAGSRVFGTPWS
jgi:hypothetical protein